LRTWAQYGATAADIRFDVGQLAHHWAHCIAPEVDFLASAEYASNSDSVEMVESFLTHRC
jgi:hypothetical protein